MSKLRTKILEAISNLKEEDGNPSLYQVFGYDSDTIHLQEDENVRKLKDSLLELGSVLNKIVDTYPNNKQVKDMEMKFYTLYSSLCELTKTSYAQNNIENDIRYNLQKGENPMSREEIDDYLKNFSDKYIEKMSKVNK